MELDSYKLYFHQDKFLDVLHAIVALNGAVPGKHAIKLVLPEDSIDLPFASEYEKNVIYFRETTSELNFETPLHFAVDEEVSRYVQETRAAFERHGLLEEFEPPFDEEGRYPVAGIHLHIRWEPGAINGLENGSDVVEFTFAAPTARVNQLFEHSGALRRGFVRLLEDHDGIYGMYENANGSQTVFWTNETHADADGLNVLSTTA